MNMAKIMGLQLCFVHCILSMDHPLKRPESTTSLQAYSAITIIPMQSADARPIKKHKIRKCLISNLPIGVAGLSLATLIAGGILGYYLREQLVGSCADLKTGCNQMQQASTAMEQACATIDGDLATAGLLINNCTDLIWNGLERCPVVAAELIKCLYGPKKEG